MSSSARRSPKQVLSWKLCVWEVGYRLLLLLGAVALALYGPIVWYPPAFLLIGILQYHFLVLSHEAQHYLIARNRRLNDLVGAWVFAYPFGQPFHSERSRHFRHHQLVGSPKDPDFARYNLEDKHPWLAMMQYYLRHIAYGKVLEYLSSGKVAQHGRRSLTELALVSIVQLCLLMIIATQVSPLFYLIFWLLPLWTVAVFLSEFREFCEHVSCSGSPLSLKTFRAPFWQRFILGPVGFVYHAEHHLFPWVPHYQLKQVASDFPESASNVEVHSSYFDVLLKCRRSVLQLAAS